MTLLNVRGLDAGYGKIPVLRGLELTVDPGEVVLLLGANGAGKTTTLLALAGVIPTSRGEVSFEQRPWSGPLDRRARQGLAFVPEGRAIFLGMSTRANLSLGRGTLDKSLDLFPELEPLLDRTAGLLSGGEQQMVVLARALAGGPKLLLIDELSLGLAPMIVQRLFDALRRAADSGVGILLVEQHARQALKIADRGYVLQRGQIVLSGDASYLLEHSESLEGSYIPGSARETQSG